MPILVVCVLWPVPLLGLREIWCSSFEAARVTVLCDVSCHIAATRPIAELRATLYVRFLAQFWPILPLRLLALVAVVLRFVRPVRFTARVVIGSVAWALLGRALPAQPGMTPFLGVVIAQCLGAFTLPRCPSVPLSVVGPGRVGGEGRSAAVGAGAIYRDGVPRVAVALAIAFERGVAHFDGGWDSAHMVSGQAGGGNGLCPRCGIFLLQLDGSGYRLARR